MSKKTVYIEVWRNEGGCGWSATAQGAIDKDNKTSEYDLVYFRRDRWDYWFKIEGKKKDAIVCSREAFSRLEAIDVAARIISGKGLRIWKIELSKI
jgi:hypothetical protein